MTKTQRLKVVEKRPNAVFCVQNFSNSRWICQKLAAEQLHIKTSSTVRQRRRMDHPSQHKSHPDRSLSSSLPDGPPCWVISLAFGLIGCYITKRTQNKDMNEITRSRQGPVLHVQIAPWAKTMTVNQPPPPPPPPTMHLFLCLEK